MNQIPNFRKHDGEMPANVHNNKGVDFCVQWQFDAGIAEFNKALRANPDYPIAYFNRGLAFTRLGLENAALTDFETVRLLMKDFNEELSSNQFEPDTIQFIEEFFGISTRK